MLGLVYSICMNPSCIHFPTDIRIWNVSSLLLLNFNGALDAVGMIYVTYTLEVIPVKRGKYTPSEVSSHINEYNPSLGRVSFLNTMLSV